MWRMWSLSYVFITEECKVIEKGYMMKSVVLKKNEYSSVLNRSHMATVWNLNPIYSLFMCQDEDENQNENETENDSFL